MINLVEIQKKLQEILNSAIGFEQYEFAVETTGFHLDKISDKNTGKNFIPVFLETMGGQHNPVPNLKQTDFNIPITFYYPVRFKDDFFLLNDYLIDIFVGQFINFGTETNTKFARCNISIPQYGEIQDLDLKQFREWVGSIYKKEIEVMQPYISMTINLYLSTSGNEFIYGDKIKVKSVSFYYGSTLVLTDTSPVIVERADIGTSETAPQQAFGETFIKGYPANLGFTKELPLIIKNTAGYRSLIDYCENTKDIQKIKVVVTEEFGFTTALEVPNTYYVTNYSKRIAYGQLFGISLTLAHLRSE